MVVLLLWLPSGGATAELQDEGSDNLQQLAQVPIRIDGDNLAQGSDLAFSGRRVIAGSYQGTALFEIVPAARGHLRQVGFHNCPGSQGDVSVYRKLVFVSIDSPGSNNVENAVCNNTATNLSETSLGKEGVRIVDISNPRQPRQVGFVEADCGSHTHTLVPSGRDLYMYISSYPLSGQGPTCNHVTHRKFSIVKVDLRDPARSDVVATRSLPPDTIGCHDITAVPERDLAIGACLGVWVTMDISDPEAPEILAEVRNPLMELDHSSAVTWDGRVAIIGDEHAGAAGGGGCSEDPSSPIGAMWFYDISDPTDPVELGHHSLPRIPEVDSAAEAERFRCTTHNFNVVPFRDASRYVVVSSYYSGGIAAIDFSDPANPEEIAYYVHRPGGVNPDTWAAYWYNGRIYTNDFQSTFGVGVYELAGTTSRKVVRYFRGDTNPQVQRSSFR
jgi:hypothetical protein